MWLVNGYIYLLGCFTFKLKLLGWVVSMVSKSSLFVLELHVFGPFVLVQFQLCHWPF